MLSALTRGESVFAAGASYFGVADLRAMAASTHDFESRYLEALVPLDEQDPRSPLAHVDRLDRPLLVLQGLDDKVVTPDQADRLLAALATRGVPHAYLPFEGEGHGFRRAGVAGAGARGRARLLRAGARVRHARASSRSSCGPDSGLVGERRADRRAGTHGRGGRAAAALARSTRLARVDRARFRAM